MAGLRVAGFLLVCGLQFFLVGAVDPDVGRLTPELVRVHGYPLEEHRVVTDDGYVLTAFRIPRGVAPRASTADRPPVLLQHALLCSSEEWVNNGPGQSLGFLLADAGFDVWLGNNRGNTWGLNHTSLDVHRPEFWDFTWDEMALHDLPALIQHVLSTTGSASLGYVGHSEGTTQAFAAFSHNQGLSAKVNLFVALAPVAYTRSQSSPAFTALAKLRFAELTAAFGFHRFMPSGSELNRLGVELCRVLPDACNVAIFLFCGPTRHINATRLPVYLSETPAGTSVKNIEHWAQQARRARFGMFDYGSAKANFARYNQSSPPLYNLSRVTVRTALFTGGHDSLADAGDVERLLTELPSSSLVLHSHLPDFAHLDFAWGVDAHTYLYPGVIRLLLQHSSTVPTGEAAWIEAKAGTASAVVASTMLLV